MSGLFATLGSSTGALQAFERVLDVTQNNVSNASTPGYAVQRAATNPALFDPAHGLPGGVSSVEISTARDGFAEQSVRGKVSALGYFEQQSASLTAVQSNFDISGQTGVPAALNGLLQSFSGLTVAPNSETSRDSVIANAQKVADSFHQASAAVAQAAQQTSKQIENTVSGIDRLAGKLREYNVERKRTPTADPGLDAKVQSTLEELSQLADISTTVASDGTTTVLLGGQTPLVLGANQYSLHTDLAPAGDPSPAYPNGTPALQVKDQSGRDITSHVTHGKLGALLQTRNSTLPGLQGDTTQSGSLNRLAKAFADRVNTILTSGNISDGPPPQAGVPLFTYDSTNDASVARTLAVNPEITARKIATINPGPPYSNNGIAVRISALAQPATAADKIDNVSFTEFYGGIAAGIGRQLSDAREETDLQKQLVVQAQSLRTQLSGVSLDAEAIHLVQFQRAYQATARLIGVLNDLTLTTVNLIK